MAELTFYVNQPRNTYPSNISNYIVVMSANFSGRFIADPADQFLQLCINVVKYHNFAEDRQLKAAWHFDRHIIDTINDDPLCVADIHSLVISSLVGIA